MFIKNIPIILLEELIIYLANIILIGLLIYQQKNQDISNYEKKIILYSELILSFIGSSVLLLYMSYILRIPFSHFNPPYFIRYNNLF